MKNLLIAFALVGIVLFAGCVSQDKYNSAITEKDNALNEKSGIQMQLFQLNTTLNEKSSNLSLCEANLTDKAKIVDFFQGYRRARYNFQIKYDSLEALRNEIDDMNSTSNLVTCTKYYDKYRDAYCVGVHEEDMEIYNQLSKYGEITNNPDCISQAKNAVTAISQILPYCDSFIASAKTRCNGFFSATVSWADFKTIYSNPTTEAFDRYNNRIKDGISNGNAAMRSCLSK